MVARITIVGSSESTGLRSRFKKVALCWDRQVTKRSAESVPPEKPRGLRGRGGERPFSNCESARSAADWRERGSETNPEDFRRSKSAAAKTKKRNEEGNSSCELLSLHEQID
jgi:hypothetical protein